MFLVYQMCSTYALFSILDAMKVTETAEYTHTHIQIYVKHLCVPEK